MKLLQIILILTAIASIHSWKQVEMLASSPDQISDLEISRWSSTGTPIDSDFDQFTCDLGANFYLGGNGKFTQNAEVSRSIDLQEHTQVQISFQIVLIDFTATDDQLKIYLDETEIASLDNTFGAGDVADITQCQQEGVNLTANTNSNREGVYTYNYAAHDFEQADLKFVLINGNNGSSTASWGIHSLQICTDGDCNPERPDPTCAVGEHFFGGACQTEAFIDACYAHVDTELRVVGDNSKFTRAATAMNADADIEITWTFTPNYVLDKDCTNYEVSIEGRKFAIDYAEATDFNEDTVGEEVIKVTASVADLTGNYECAETSDANHFIHTCKSHLSIYSGHGLQYRENIDVVVKFSKDVSNTISVEVEQQTDEDITSCCENVFNISTELQICGTDATCANPQNGSAAAPYNAYRGEAIYFRHAISDAEFNTQFLKLKSFSFGYGYFPDLEQAEIDSEAGYAQWKFTPMFSGSGIEFTAISVISDDNTDPVDQMTGDNTLARRVLVETDNTYKLKGKSFINVISKTSTGNGGDQIDGGDGQQIVNTDDLKEKEEAKGTDTTLIAIISAFIGAIIISLCGGAYYVKFIKNREDKYVEKKSEKSDIEASEKDFGSTTVQNLKTFDNVKENN